MSSEMFKNMSFGSIIGNSLKYNFTKIRLYMRHLMPPVFMQILGVLISIVPVWAFRGLLNTSEVLYLTIVFFGLLIGLVIFCKYFWDYLLAYGALFSMSKEIMETGNIVNPKEYIEALEKRGGGYIGLLLLLFLIPIVCILIAVIASVVVFFACVMISKVLATLLSLIAFFIIYLVLAFMVYTYFFLSLPAFVLDKDITPAGALSKSINLVSGCFWQTLGLSFLGNIITNIITQTITSIIAIPFSIIIMIVMLSLLATSGGGDTAAAEATMNTVSIIMYAMLMPIMIIFSVILLPFMASVSTCWYFKREAHKTN